MPEVSQKTIIIPGKITEKKVKVRYTSSKNSTIVPDYAGFSLTNLSYNFQVLNSTILARILHESFFDTLCLPW